MALPRCNECPMHQDDHDMIVEMRADLKDLIRTVKGNGQPGLVQRVGSLELWRSTLIGAWVLGAAAVAIYAAVK